MLFKLFIIQNSVLYKVSDTDKTDNATCEIIYDNLISHVKIIAFQTIIIHCLWIFHIARKDCSLYNKQQDNTCVLGNTRFTSRVEDEIFPRTHV